MPRSIKASACPVAFEVGVERLLSPGHLPSAKEGSAGSLLQPTISIHWGGGVVRWSGSTPRLRRPPWGQFRTRAAQQTIATVYRPYGVTLQRPQ